MLATKDSKANRWVGWF